MSHLRRLPDLDPHDERARRMDRYDVWRRRADEAEAAWFERVRAALVVVLEEGQHASFDDALRPSGPEGRVRPAAGGA